MSLTPWRRWGAVLALCLATACSKAPPSAPAAGVSPQVAEAHAAVKAQLASADPQAAADAERGLLAAPHGQIKADDGSVIWDFDAFRFVQGEAPPTVNPSLWRQALLNNRVGLFKVTEGIWQLRGFDLANITLIQGKTGWIVVDALTAKETAAAALAFARQQLGPQPVSAVIFTHSHVDHFGGALGLVSAEEAASRKLPVVAPAGFMEEATSENILLGAAMARRAMWMYGNRLPRDAQGVVDTGLGKALAMGRVGILPPTVLVGGATEPMDIDGVRFVFHAVPGSEAPAEFVFELPELKAFCGAELTSHTLHNLYTLRGAKVRDAMRWAGYLDAALQQTAGAQVLFGQHHWPVWGSERIQHFIRMQRDAYQYIHDQTVRMMNAGLTSTEIAEQLALPKALQAEFDVHGYYGTVRHNAKAVYQYYLGWFDAHPATLDPLPPREAAKRYVALAGGAKPAVAAAQQAFDAGDFRWAAELLRHVVFAEPEQAEAKALLARTLSQLGYLAESAPWRNFYLTGALELRDGPPKQGVTAAQLVDMLQYAPIERYLEAMAAAVNGPKADGVQLVINLRFTDLGENYVLALSNGVLHHRRAPADAQANATLELTKPFFLRMMTGQAGAKELLLSDQTHIRGSTIDLGRFFGLIDKAPGTFPIMARP